MRPSPRTLLIAPALAALLVIGAPVTAQAADDEAQTAPRAAVRNSLKAPSNVMAGERITLRATQKRGRVTLKVQRKVGARWVLVKKVRKAKKKFSVATRVPRTATGVLRYRLTATVRGQVRVLAGARTPVKRQRLRLTNPAATTAGAATTFAATLTPTRPGRKVQVQEWVDGAWRTVQTTASGRGSAVRPALTTAGYPTWYRLVAIGHRGAPAVSTDPVRNTLRLVPTAIAHRASGALAPELTLAALDKTLAVGAPAMEIDVQLTKDGKLVVVHDKTWDRTTDIETVFPAKVAAGENKIADLTLAEVQQLDASTWFTGYTGPVQRVPTLEEWLTRLDGRSELVLEIKDPEVAGNAQVVTVLDGLMQPGQPLRELADAGKLTVSSFGVGVGGPNQPGIDALKHFHDLNLGIPVGYLAYGIVPSAVPTWADQVHSLYPTTTRASVLAQQAAGRSVSVWALGTFNTVAQHRTAIATGANRIITDDPRALTAALHPSPPPLP